MSPPDELSRDSRFGRYQVVRLIGTGGMGRVYEAVMVELNKRVALKTLASHLADQGEALERFLREGRAAARVRHSNMVQIFDVGIEQGIPFLAMEFLEGRDLRTRFDQGPMGVPELVDWVLPVAGAIGAAHDVGVIHRDLKPENIFLSSEQGGEIRPVVLDFGVSKLTESSVHLTRTTSMMGTPLYMSPQQAGGARDVDPRTDQYSLAVVLYEGLCGRVPFEAASLMELASKLSDGLYPAPRTLRPELPPRLEEIVLRGMHRDPAQRFASMYAFGAALLPFASPSVSERWRRVFESHMSQPPPPPASVTLESQASVMGPAVARSVKNTLDRAAASMSKPVPQRPWPRLVAFLALGAVIAGVVAFRWLRGSFAETGPATALSANAAASGETYVVRVQVTPAEAEIVLDGSVVARGSWATRLPLDGRAHTLVVGSPGFVAQSATFRDVPPPETFTLVPQLAKPETTSVPDVAPAASSAATLSPRRPPKAALRRKETRPAETKTPPKSEGRGPGTSNKAPILD